MLSRIRSLVLLALLPSLAHAQATNSYTQSNLISDGSVKAQQTDTQLINPWGVTIGQQTPFWINTTGTGLSEVYDAGANKQFVVTIPTAGGSGKVGSPTGIVFNPSTTDFALPQGSAAYFIFDALDGTISAWNPSVTNAVVVADNSATGAAYTGLAIVNNSSGIFLLAANFSKSTIDVFDSTFAPATLSGSFTDPSIPSGFAPFNIHVINNQVFVMYAQQNPAGGPPTTGAAAGYVSVFDNNGKFVSRAISGGNLNAPWGLALAPASFGAFGGDLLVGNFGDGTINAYDPVTFVFKGQLQDSAGKPIQNENLWEILFGSNGTGDPNTLYFSAGVNNEKGGLFGAIAATAPPSAKGDFTIDLAQSALTVTQGGSASVQLNVSPSNGFASPVAFTVSGLPTGATFAFSPTSVTPAAGANASTTLTITAGTSTAPPPNPYSTCHLHRGPTGELVALGALVPIGFSALIPVLRNRRKYLNSLLMGGGTLSLLFVLVLLAGCSGTKSTTNPNPVPTGASTVTVTATSGSLTHTTTLSLTVQ